MAGERAAHSGRRMCPSARAAEGALLLGVVGENGQIAFLPELGTVDRMFVDTARQGRPPEQRFRFASFCVERGCDKWTGDACGIGDMLAALDPAAWAAGDGAGSCSISSQCRWRSEHGPSICKACTFVVTERGAANQGG